MFTDEEIELGDLPKVEEKKEEKKDSREAKKADNPAAFLAEKENEYQQKVANPYVAAQRGYIDDIIEPAKTRTRIVKALGLLQNKRDTNPMKKHGNIPL